MTHRAALESKIELVVQEIFANKSKDRPHEMLRELTSGGFAPVAFLIRADGSRMELHAMAPDQVHEPEPLHFRWECMESLSGRRQLQS